MQILTLSWPWALFGSKFCIIFSISLLEKLRVFNRFSVVQWRLRGSSILLSKNIPFSNEGIKKFSFFLEICYTFISKEKRWIGEHLFIIDNLRYVGLLVELSISSSIICCCSCYYFKSFYKNCFSLEWDFFFVNQRGSL